MNWPDKRHSRFQSEKNPHALEFRIKLSPKRALSRRIRIHISEVRHQLTILDRQISPTNHAVSPQQRKRVITSNSLGHRRVGLEAIGPSPQQFEATSVPHDGVEWREQPDGIVCRA